MKKFLLVKYLLYLYRIHSMLNIDCNKIKSHYAHETRNRKQLQIAAYLV